MTAPAVPCRDKLVETLLGHLRHFLTVPYCAGCNRKACQWRQAALQVIASLDAVDGKKRPVNKSQMGCASKAIHEVRHGR